MKQSELRAYQIYKRLLESHKDLEAYRKKIGEVDNVFKNIYKNIIKEG